MKVIKHSCKVLAQIEILIRKCVLRIRYTKIITSICLAFSVLFTFHIIYYHERYFLIFIHYILGDVRQIAKCEHYFHYLLCWCVCFHNKDKICVVVILILLLWWVFSPALTDLVSPRKVTKVKMMMMWRTWEVFRWLMTLIMMPTQTTDTHIYYDSSILKRDFEFSWSHSDSFTCFVSNKGNVCIFVSCR